MKVCYKQSSTDVIEWGEAEKVDGRGNKARVIFEDGGWCPAGECFFTEDQCRRYYKLPPKDWKAVNLAVADRLEKLADSIRNK